MGLVVLEGLIILVLVLTGFRKAVFDAVPATHKTAISVGIGLFITLIGLVDAASCGGRGQVRCRSSSAWTVSCSAGWCWCSASACC